MLNKEFIMEQILEVSRLPILLGVDGISCVQTMADKIIETFQQQHKVVTLDFGDFGGLAHHLAGELKKGLIMVHPPLPVKTTGFEDNNPSKNKEVIIAQKLEELTEPNDILWILAEKGHTFLDSLITKAQKLDLCTLVFCGFPKPAKRPDYLFYVPLANKQRIEEVFLIIGHILCTLVESILFADGHGI